MPEHCPICGGLSLDVCTGEYKFDPPSNIPGGTIIIHSASWEECTNCGEQIISLELEQQLENVRRERLGLLTPEEIRNIRDSAGLTQIEMAQLLGLGDKTYTRWESGKSLQNKSSDNLMRLFAQHSDFFAKLDAQRSVHRKEQIREYISSLENLEGKNIHSIAAHGGQISSITNKALRERLKVIVEGQKENS